MLTWGPPPVAGGLTVLEMTSASARGTCNTVFPGYNQCQHNVCHPQVKTVEVLTVPKEQPREG